VRGLWGNPTSVCCGGKSCLTGALAGEDVVRVDWSLTGVLAIWGAVLSTGLAVIRVIDLVRERPILKVWGDRVLLSSEALEGQKYFRFTAVNTGKRPVTVCGCHVEMKNGERVLIPPAAGFRQPLPKKLEIGEHVAYMVPPGPVDQLRWNEPGPRGVLFTDAAGNEYRGPLKDGLKQRPDADLDIEP